MKKLIYLVLGLIIGASALTVSAQVRNFTSLQLAPTPSSGNCLKTDGVNNLWSASCGSGGGSGGGTWSTTTSQTSGVFINYPNETDDVVVIGSTASTSAEWWYDPSTTIGYLKGFFGIGTTSPFTSLGVAGTITANNINATGTVTSTFAVPPTFTTLTSALLLTGSGGLTAEYTGTTCTNQFVRVLSALGVATCETVDISADTNLTAGDALTLTGDDIDFDGGATPSGDLGGTWASPSVTDDSHAHTGSTISGLDISADTNLTAGDGLTLTDDDLDCDTSSGSVFGCLSSADWTTFNNKVASTLTLTVAGTVQQITSSAGAQDLSANRTWTLSLPAHVKFPGNFEATRSTTTHATTTNLDVTGLLTFNSVTGSTWASFCTAITGGSGLCDGDDATGAGGAFAWTPTTFSGTVANSTSTPIWFTATTPYSTMASSTLTSATTTTGALQVGSTAIASNVVKVSHLTGLTVSNSESVGGVFNMNTGTTDSIGMVLYNNHTGTNRLLSMVCDAATFGGNCLHVRSDGTESALNVLGSPTGKGITKIGSNGVGDTDASGLSIDTSLSSFVGQGIFLKGNATGKLLNIRDENDNERLTLLPKGALGLGTTTPAWQLQVASSTGPQFTLTDPNGPANKKHWTERSVGGNWYLATSSDAYATSTTPAITINGASNVVTFGNSSATCIALTGSSALCDGDDATGAGGGIGDPFTHTSFSAVQTSATSTLLNLTGSPLSLAASSTYANLATTSQLTIGAYGSNVGIYFTEDGDGALTLQGIGNNGNESFTLNLDDTADVGVWSSGTGATAFDYTNLRGRWDGLVIDGDATYPASADGSLLIGDGSDGGTFEMEDGPGCFGDGGCTPNAQDGSLTVATLLGVATSTMDWPLVSFSSTQPQLALSAGAGVAQWTMRNSSGNLYFSTTTVAGNATTTSAAFSILSTGEVIARNLFQVINTSGTLIMNVVGNAVTLLGAWDFGGATSIEVVNGTGPTVDATGEIAVDTTNDQLIYFGATAKRVVTPFQDMGFAYATTTWSGTTTLRIGPSPAAITVTNAYCETDTGTVGVSLYDGTNRALYMPTASTTINNFLYTASNNSFTAGETIRVDIGTPATSPRALSCRFMYTYDAT